MDVVDVTERLMAEFEDRLDLALIAQVVRSCEHEVADAGQAPSPELVEQLAHRRLLERLVPAPRRGAGDPHP